MISKFPLGRPQRSAPFFSKTPLSLFFSSNLQTIEVDLKSFLEAMWQKQPENSIF